MFQAKTWALSPVIHVRICVLKAAVRSNENEQLILFNKAFSAKKDFNTLLQVDHKFCSTFFGGCFGF